jgi:hypothetical protein
MAAGPGGLGGVANHDGVVAFLDLMVIESSSDTAGGAAVFGKEEYATGGAVETVAGLHFLADLIAEDLECHLIVRMRMAGGMDELACRFVDCDQVGIFVED